MPENLKKRENEMYLQESSALTRCSQEKVVLKAKELNDDVSRLEIIGTRVDGYLFQNSQVKGSTVLALEERQYLRFDVHCEKY